MNRLPARFRSRLLPAAHARYRARSSLRVCLPLLRIPLYLRTMRNTTTLDIYGLRVTSTAATYRASPPRTTHCAHHRAYCAPISLACARLHRSRCAYARYLAVRINDAYSSA